MLRRIKGEIRVLGIDDSPFDKATDRSVTIIGVFFRGGHFMDGVLSTKAEVDGSDSTKRIAEMVCRSKFYTQIQCIMLDGIAVGGFNIIDINKLSNETGIPVIVTTRDNPDLKRIKQALKRLKMDEKIALLEKAGPIIRIGKIRAQLSNIDEETARRIIEATATRSHIPEPIRVAHLMASGLVLGESRGKV